MIAGNICQKVKCFLAVLSVLVIVASARYIAGWRTEMEAVQILQESLAVQDAVRWTEVFYREPKCFPVRGTPQGEKGWVYEDGYGEGRSYGGSRKHEGIDIMSLSGERGQMQIQSVSDGVVEQIGWLKLGGYRVGIRAPSGLYYYYAHLDSYAKQLKKGDRVRAGQVLGRMGDSGYGPEGTRG